MSTAESGRDGLARRNARVLACAQALGGSSPAIVISLGGIVGQGLAHDKTLATLPVSLLNLGLALGTIPAAMLMRQVGRRNGYLFGATLGVIAGSVAAAGIALSAFPIFCLGTFLAGFYASYVQSYRFAAADSASPDFRAQAISWVMAGGLAAAVIGPQVASGARDLVPGAPFAGSFLGQAVLALLSIAVVSFLRPVPAGDMPKSGGRPLGAIVRQPRFLVAVAAGLVSYGLMSFVMTAAPLAMIGCGHPIGAATLGISWHILAMFGPSFFTGSLIARFGAHRIVAAGLLLLIGCAIVALSGTAVAHF